MYYLNHLMVYYLQKGQGLLKHYFSFSTKFESCEFEIFSARKNENKKRMSLFKKGALVLGAT